MTMPDQDGGSVSRVARCPLPAAVHVVGIGGMHMSAIAQILIANGVRVSGSDQNQSGLTEKLRALGAEVRYGHAAGHVGDVELVVQTAAAKADNPELEEAHRRGIPVISRAAMVARLMQGRTGICVAGTHGKTTTSSMIAWMLRVAGRDPSFLLGGESLDLGTNAHAGTGDEIVVEADEYARAFLEYQPAIAVITNVEPDHLEYYGSEDAYVEAFRQFMERVPPAGVIIACAGSPRLAALAAARGTVEEYLYYPYVGGSVGDEPHHVDGAGQIPSGRRISVSLPPFPTDGDTIKLWQGKPVWQGVPTRSPEAAHQTFVVTNRMEPVAHFSLALPGAHMASNALAAIAVGSHLGLAVDMMQRALASFRGARRRFELVGETRGVTVIDDFAHHPTEVRVNLTAARERFPGRRIVLIFQPHTYSRTTYLWQDFISCFAKADKLYILETFASRETAEAGLGAMELATAVKSPPAEYVRTADDAAGRLLAELRSGDVLVTMGAGDVDRVGRAVLAGWRSP